MRKNKNNTIIVFTALIALIASLFDIYKNPNTFQKYFYINSSTLLIIFLIIYVYFRYKHNYIFPKIGIKLNNYLIFPISVISTIVLTVTDYLHSPNYVFSKYAINYDRIGYIALSSLFFLFISLILSWWKKNYKKIIFLSVPFFYFIFLLIELWPFDFFKKFVSEDNFIENLQFFVILSSSFISFKIAKHFHNINKFFTICYFLFGIFLFLIAGDEISWGQRIIGFQTPQNIEIKNTQGELTLHNLNSVVDYTWIAYLLISIYGSFGFLFKYILPKSFKKIFTYISIPSFATPYFIFPLIYHLITRPWQTHNIGHWSEIAELMMYFGILFYCLNVHKPSGATSKPSRR